MAPRARTGVIVGESADEAVVFDSRTSRTTILNATAAFVWRHCDGNRSPGEIAALLADSMSVIMDPAVVARTLDDLREIGLIENTPD